MYVCVSVSVCVCVYVFMCLFCACISECLSVLVLVVACVCVMCVCETGSPRIHPFPYWLAIPLGHELAAPVGVRHEVLEKRRDLGKLGGLRGNKNVVFNCLPYMAAELGT